MVDNGSMVMGQVSFILLFIFELSNKESHKFYWFIYLGILKQKKKTIERLIK